MTAEIKTTKSAWSATRTSALQTATASTERGRSLSTLTSYLTVAEIAASLKVDAKTVGRWLRDPEHPLKGTKVGTMWRVHPEDFKTFMKEQLK